MADSTTESLVGQVPSNNGHGKEEELEPLFAFASSFDRSSREWEKLEHYNSGLGDIEDFKSDNFIQAAKSMAQKASPIPFIDTRIFSMMELSEYLVGMQGDLWQTIVAPISVGLTDFRVNHKTKKKEIKQILDNMGMREFIEQMWLDIEVYGQAFPMEFWDGDTPTGLTLLNPKTVVIQPTLDMATQPLFLIPDSKEKGLELAKQEMFVRSLAPTWGEYWKPPEAYTGFLIEAENVYHVHHHKYAHQVYAIPPLVRAARSISTRLMLEEMIRSTIEGVKNQLFIWKITNPKRGEKALLQSLIMGARASRTGNFVWDERLDLQQVIPQSVDALLGNDTWQRLTLDIFRQLGIVLRTISGEVANVGQARDFEVDVQLYLRRIEFARKRVLSWVNRWVNRYAKSRGIPWDAPIISFTDMELQTKLAIKNVVQPMLNFGFLDPTTALETAGFDPETVIGRLKESEKNGERALFRPYAGFAQTTVKPSGTQTTTESPMSPGRPTGQATAQEDVNADSED